MLCREVLVIEPYQFKKGTVERGNLWTAIADNLNNVQEIKFRIKPRSVRERYDLLVSRFRNKIRQEERETGTSPPELTEVESMLEEIIERENLASSQVNQSNKAKVDNERKAYGRNTEKESNVVNEQGGFTIRIDSTLTFSYLDSLVRAFLLHSTVYFIILNIC